MKRCSVTRALERIVPMFVPAPRRPSIRFDVPLARGTGPLGELALEGEPVTRSSRKALGSLAPARPSPVVDRSTDRVGLVGPRPGNRRGMTGTTSSPAGPPDRQIRGRDAMASTPQGNASDWRSFPPPQAVGREPQVVRRPGHLERVVCTKVKASLVRHLHMSGLIANIREEAIAHHGDGLRSKSEAYRLFPRARPDGVVTQALRRL